MDRATGEITWGPCRKLDYEMELGFFIANGNAHGHPIPAAEAEEHIFGAVLVNDWSARDHQGFEMAPLGPFNSKNFATSISPWVVTLDALAPFRTPLPPRKSAEAKHVQSGSNMGIDIKYSCFINGEHVATTNTSCRYYSPA